MSKTPEKPRIPRVDIPEISETFSDSLGSVGAGNGVFKIDFLVSRAHMINDNAPPVMKKYTAARLVLTNEAAVELVNMLHNVLTAMNNPKIFKGVSPTDKIN